MTRDVDQLVLDRIIAAGRQRGITRRSFVAHATAAGLTVPAATGLWTSKVSASTPSQGGKFRVAVQDANTSDTHDPGQYLSVFMIQLAHCSRSYLCAIEPDGSLGPDMADSWSASPDAKVWTFELNQNASFHDGRKFTSKDALASIRHHLGEDSTSAAASLLSNVVDVRADGDFTRQLATRRGGHSASYLNNNRNKRSIVLDLKDQADQAALKALVATADVFIQNFRPGVADRLGLRKETQRALKPRLVHMTIAGFG